MRSCVLLMVVVLGWASWGCGLIKMPFRVAGSVASHTYQAGKRVVKKSPKQPDSGKTEPPAATTAKPGETAPAAKPAAGSAGSPVLPKPPPAATGEAPEPPANPNVPVPPPDLPEMPGDILPPLPEELPPL
jgi:hypothetical protein